MAKLELITCSYLPDADRCERLCRSVDQFVAKDIAHTLIVPRRDYDTFAPLANSRRRVLKTEDVVPGHFRQLPISQRWWLGPYGWPVRGWVMQQVLKLSVDRATDAELLMFADSDLQFVRPFDVDMVSQSNQLRLHRVPEAKQRGRHLHWHYRASDLLGLERAYAGADYVGQLITWRRDRLLGLQAHIESVTGRPWYVSVARSLHVSEYILYGMYAEHVVGQRNSGHYFEQTDLCHCCWFAEQAQQLSQGETRLGQHEIALLLQSNLGLRMEQETAVAHAALAPDQGTLAL